MFCAIGPTGRARQVGDFLNPDRRLAVIPVWPRHQAARTAGSMSTRPGVQRSGPGFWWCQAVGPAKARVTAAVRLETCSSR
jgi:hypothetical protein